MTSTAGAWGRATALVVAMALVGMGLWLAVSAGARGGESARDAAYTVRSHYRAVIDKHPRSKTRSSRATFKFHLEADRCCESNLQYMKTVCKVDKRKPADCQSPKTYRRLKRGKHSFWVKGVWKNCAGAYCDTTVPAAYHWTVK